MSSVSIKNGELELFKRILKDGYAIEDGKDTKRIVRELKRANVPICHGYAQETKKVIIAMESPFRVVRRRRTLTKTIFSLVID